jgi:PAS domain S-box-containing protein
MADTPPAASILVVDDDRGLLRLMEKSLRRAGYTVSTATSGAEALAWLEQQQPDLLVLDLKLQDIEGREFISHLESLGRSVPFIIITGQGDERVAVDMMKRGALDYLIKDVRFQEFVPTVVARALERVGKEQRLAAAEDGLKRESAFNQAVFNTSGAALMVLDSRLRIVRFNQACESLTEFAFEEVRGKLVWDFLTIPGEVNAVKDVFEQLRAWAPALHSENRWRTKSGDVRNIAWAHTALRDAEGKLEFIISSGLDLTERKRLEKEVLEISDREQRRIGQDLHDGLGQELTGIEMMCQVFHQQLAKKNKEEAARAEEIARHVREAIAHTRSLARGLSPVSQDTGGLMSSLEELAGGVERVFRVKCTFHCPSPVLVPDNAVATHLFRIAQEAVTNAIKHGRAKKIKIALSQVPECLILAVRDDGAGLPKELPPGRGMGLRIMQYRTGLIGGSLAIQKEQAGGTAVVCTVHKLGAS